MIDMLGLLTYPALSAISLLSCAMRLLSLWRTRGRNRKLLILALTNLCMFVAFGLVAFALQNPEWSATVRPYRIIAWSLCAPFYAASVYLEWRENLEAAKANP